MKKVVFGNLKFLKPVVEKVIDVHYLVEEDGKEVLKHRYLLLTYEELSVERKEKFLEEIYSENPKLIVIDETDYIDFGDEEIERHLDSIVYYDEKWIEKFNPDKEHFEEWLAEFIDELIFPTKKK